MCGKYPLSDFDLSPLCHLGVALANAGHLTQAAAAYDAVARCHTQDGEARLATLRLADLMPRIGHSAAARAWYPHITNAWPDSEEALEAASWLRGIGRAG